MNDKLYNKDIKMEYLETQIPDEGTRTMISFEFYKTAKLEKELDKDVFAFNDIEIDSLLKSMRRSNVMSIRRTLSVLNSYVKWAIANGKRGKYENNINYMDIFIKTETDFNKFVSNKQLAGKILNKNELNDMVNAIANPIDQALILCLYEFIGGAGLYEIRSMEISNINKETNEIKLFSANGNSRIQKISSKLIELLEESNRTKTYLVNNGEPDKREYVIEKAFVKSKYVFKPLRRGDNDFRIMNYHALLRRIAHIGKFTGYNHITANSIVETRIIHEIIDETEKRRLYEPDDSIYEDVIYKLENDYNINITNMKVYSIKQKVDQLLDIKEF